MNQTLNLAATLAIVIGGASSAGAAPFTIGADFTGTDLSVINASHIPKFGFPPDTMGAVGPDHIGELINTSFAVYDKTGAVQSRVPLEDFWANAFANAGTAATIPGPFDPRLLYDPSSSRWYAASVGDERNGAGRQLLIGVTTGDDPSLANWRGFTIDMDSTNALEADFPTIGLDHTALYISNNMYPVGSLTDFNSISLVGVPKASLTAAEPSIAGFRLESRLTTSKTGFSMQPAVDLDGGSSPLEALGTRSPSLSYLKRTLIPADWITGTSNIPNPAPGDTLSYPQSLPPNARQPGPYDTIDTFDNRLTSNVVLQNGSLWSVQGKDVGGHAAFDFFEIDGTSPTASFKQQITISDPSLDLYYPSVAVNDLGDVVIGFSGSDDNTPISTYIVVGTTTDGVTEFGPITQTHAGSGGYYIRLDELGRNRWGDFSATVVDPVKPRTFWTFQEFVSDNMATPPFYDNWAVRITEITLGEVDGSTTPVPEPATGALLLLAAGLLYLRRRTSDARGSASDVHSRRQLTESCDSLADSRSRRQPLISRLINLALMLGMLLAGVAGQAQATQYDIVAIDYPGATETETWGINDAGEIVGVYRIGTDTYHSFILSDGVFTPFEHPDAVSGGYMSTWINDINSAGQIVGAYDVGDALWRGFLYDGANFVDVEPLAGSPGTFPDSLNDSGQVAGYYNEGSIDRGFLFDGTSYVTIRNSNAVHTFAGGINNAGVIVGYGWFGSDELHAFRRDVDGRQINFWVGNTPAQATGINDSGQIVGSYGPNYDDHYGFVLSGAIGSTPDRLVGPGARVTEAHDINNLGQVVGWYTDRRYYGGARHGFLATPIPELPGDYNDNGLVEQADLDLVLSNWGAEITDPAAAGWLSDPPTGIVHQAHLDKVLLNWGSSAALAASTAAGVPEASSLTLLALGFLSLLLRKPERWHRRGIRLGGRSAIRRGQSDFALNREPVPEGGGDAYKTKEIVDKAVPQLLNQHKGDVS